MYQIPALKALFFLHFCFAIVAVTTTASLTWICFLNSCQALLELLQHVICLLKPLQEAPHVAG